MSWGRCRISGLYADGSAGVGKLPGTRKGRSAPRMWTLRRAQACVWPAVLTRDWTDCSRRGRIKSAFLGAQRMSFLEQTCSVDSSKPSRGTRSGRWDCRGWGSRDLLTVLSLRVTYTCHWLSQRGSRLSF